MPRKFNPKVADKARELIGQHIRSRRNQLGWTQDQLASVADIRRATVTDVENGKPYELNTLIAIIGSMRGELQLIWNDIDSIPGYAKPEKN